MGIIRGSMYKKCWLNKNDLVLCSIRTEITSKKKCDIIFKYTSEEIRILKRSGELPEKETLIDNVFSDEQTQNQTQIKPEQLQQIQESADQQEKEYLDDEEIENI